MPLIFRYSGCAHEVLHCALSIVLLEIPSIPTFILDAYLTTFQSVQCHRTHLHHHDQARMPIRGPSRCHGNSQRCCSSFMRGWPERNQALHRHHVWLRRWCYGYRYARHARRIWQHDRSTSHVHRRCIKRQGRRRHGRSRRIGCFRLVRCSSHQT
jgi:hypothetical protein